MFLGLQDPGSDPLVRGTDPDPSIIKQEKYGEPWFLLFSDFFMTPAHNQVLQVQCVQFTIIVHVQSLYIA
jgi:hypothetical protein